MAAALAGVIWLNRDALGAVLVRVELRPILALPVLFFVMQVAITGLRAVVLLGGNAWRDTRGCIGCHVVAQFSNQLVPAGAGDFVLKGGCLAKRLKRPFRAIAGVVLLDRLFDAALAAALAPVLLLVLSGRLGPLSGLGIAAVIIVCLPWLMHAVLRPVLTGAHGLAAWRAGGGRLANAAQSLKSLYQDRRRVLTWAHAVTVLRLAAMSGGLGLLHWLMFGDDLWLVVVLAAPITQFALLLPLAPGGLGVVEGAWFGVLTLAGADNGAALAFALAVRVLIVVGTLAASTIALGGHGWAAWRMRGSAESFDAASGEP